MICIQILISRGCCLWGIAATPSSLAFSVGVRVVVLVASVEKWDAVGDTELHKLTLARGSTRSQLHAGNTIVFLNTYKEYFIQ